VRAAEEAGETVKNRRRKKDRYYEQTREKSAGDVVPPQRTR